MNSSQFDYAGNKEVYPTLRITAKQNAQRRRTRLGLDACFWFLLCSCAPCFVPLYGLNIPHRKSFAQSTLLKIILKTYNTDFSPK